MPNEQLSGARRNVNDEFYTRLEDIELELKHYKEYFRGKKILCNCDDPFESNFFKYFALNFNSFGLKKLTATCYNGSTIAGNELELDFGEKDKTDRIAYKVELSEVTDITGDGAIDMEDIKATLKSVKVVSELKGNGDFRSEECIELLKDADIVVTNPPFSLFREYVGQLDDFNKDFIIMGNTNALVCKEVFRMFKQDRIRTGCTHFNTGMFFYVPDSFEKFHHIENGKKLARVSTSCWYTNLPVKKHNEELILFKPYSPTDYPKYENYNAIEVGRYTDIPCDFDGIMGVPITFLDKYNPNQFEIIWQGSGNTRASAPKEILEELGYQIHKDDRGGCAILNGKRCYTRVFIRKKK